MWPEAGDQLFQRYLAFLLGDFKRIVIYHQDRQHVRAVHELSDLGAAGRQQILGGRLEWEGPIPKSELRQAIDLLDEFPRIDERGRPLGSRRPKRKPHEAVELRAEWYLRLQQCGLTRKQIRVFALWIRGTSLVKIARELHISAPATRRLLLRAEKKLKKENPDFSLSKFKQAQEPEHVGTGRRWNRRPIDRDRSGKPYVRDSKKLLEQID
jgi:hypothetical protein